jgi:hypothetical protein
MGQPGFNPEQNQTNWILGEPHHFLTNRLKCHICYILCVISLSYTNTYTLMRPWQPL